MDGYARLCESTPVGIFPVVFLFHPCQGCPEVDVSQCANETGTRGSKSFLCTLEIKNDNLVLIFLG